MPQIINFDFNQINQGDFTQVHNVVNDLKTGSITNGNNLLYAIDALCTNETFMKSFKNSFDKEWNGPKYDSEKQDVKFRALTSSEMEEQKILREKEIEKVKQSGIKQFDVLQTNITPTIGTTIVPTIEKLIRDTSLLSKITPINKNAKEFHQIYDFDAEQDASILTEVASGTDVDEVLRTGDQLIPNQKIQASMKMSEFVLSTLSPEDLGTYIARLARRVEHRLVVAILSNGNGVANGTARGSNIRGILNNYGVNGTGDASNSIGAIAYATKATADAAIVANGGVASTNAYDLCYKMSLFGIPSNISDVEEGEYIFIGNRFSWGAISTVPDSNGRYLGASAIDPITGKLVKQINGIEFVTVPQSQIPNNRVYLVPLKFYKLITNGNLLNLSDNGVVSLREGITQLVSRTWVNGSIEYGHKFRPTTAVTVGTTTPDNLEQNAFRVFNLT